MAAEWDDVMLWALAEELSKRMDAIREEQKQAALPEPVAVEENIIDARQRFQPRN